MKEIIRVAAVSVESHPGEAARNLDRIADWAAKASSEGADLALFPELSLTGFIPNHPTADHSAWLRDAVSRARRMAEPLDGPSVTRLSEIAVSTNMHISAGLLEDAGNLLHNTHVLVSPSGRRWHWRKLHVPTFETPFYNGGSGLDVAETDLGRVGTNICFDALIPESTRLLAVRGVEIVLFPFAADPAPGTAAAWSDWASTALRARCAENGVFGVACNYLGTVEFCGVKQTFPGGAMIAGPSGEVIAQCMEDGGTPGMLIADLKRGTLLDAQASPEYLYRFRRPELYGPLTQRGSIAESGT